MEHKQEQQKSETALREEEVLAFWKEQGVFEKSLAKKAPQGEFVFYDGPPFATGLPHMGHLLISAYKDVVGRYKTMRGFHVSRRWGWDCHGLPIENIVEKKLGLTTKKEIETMGIDRFNEEARKSVLTYVHDWKKYIERIGRWVDFDHSYKTMDNSYIESVWWALKKIHEDGRLYEGRKVLMYCPRCETPLSKAEIAMDNSYKDVQDEAVYVKFKVGSRQSAVGERNTPPQPSPSRGGGALVLDESVPTYILAWTTTPWTLPANMALAINPNIEYVVVSNSKEQYIVAKKRLDFLGDGWVVIKELQGIELFGLSYEPLYVVEKVQMQEHKKVHTVLSANFVTDEDGAGVVHIAPVYGEDDYALGAEHNLPMVPLLDATGTFNNDAPELVRGMYYKKGGKFVIEDLEKRELLFKKHTITHSYPHCYRCGTALIYNALTSWFINIQKVKERLLEANEEIHWYPEHLKHGRFGNSVASAPDWTISRNRFWASPLPIWKHEKTGEVQLFGSLAEVREHTKKSGNTYYTVRHGQSESNVQGIASSDKYNPHHLTEQGRLQVQKAGEFLKGKGITKIVASPFVRTRETVALLAELIGLSEEHIVFEDRFGEWHTGETHNTRPVADIHALLPTLTDRFARKADDTAETLSDMKRRVGEALYELEETYTNETILIVTHEYTAWLLESIVRGVNVEETVALAEELRGAREDIIENAEVRELSFVPLPHNADYELDLHRPYVDELSLLAKDGARLIRIPEVVDCWVESGAMPFASEHYPMEHKEEVKNRYPGDFIAEYIAQTRTWFYYMHALGVLLFNAPSFKNAVVTGTIMASDGTKMSKSKGNYTDPLENIDRYGADALRFYLLGGVVMQAEDMAFKDEELREAHNRFVNMLWNTYTFYTMYVGEESAVGIRQSGTESKNILDRWVFALLAKTVREVTEHMDAYDTVRASRALRDFVTDFSTWYVRRSRDRFKSEDVEDRENAKATTREVLLALAKLSAPITPFIAESIYRGLQGEEESVHLAEWPEIGKEDGEICEKMETTRKLVSEALELRSKAGVKVRQPLASLTIPNGADVYKELIADEVNVKEIHEGETLVLDTVLTPALILEGDVRELLRAVQGLRKEKGLNPEDEIVLRIVLPDTLKPVLDSARDILTRNAGVSSVETVAVLSEKSMVHCSSGELSIQIFPTA